MTQFVAVPPPFVKDGKLLSSYFTNQLSETVNAVGGSVYGANVPRWVENSSDTLRAEDNIYSLVHKYDSLRIKFNFGNTDMLFKVYLTKDDGVLGTKVYENSVSSDGPLTITIDLSTNPNGFSVNEGELYFIRLYSSEVGTSSDFWQVEYVREVNPGSIVKPTLSDITSSTVISASYLNSLVTAARDLRTQIQPSVLPFVGFTLNGSQGRTDTFVRYRLRHFSRWLHYGFKAAESGGGADGVILYLDNVKLQSWSNNNTYQVSAFDMNALPNGVSTPAFGTEYELKFEITRTSGIFQLFYLWELPYI